MEDASKSTPTSTIIVVHGDVLDKIGFDLAERANKSAELRLEKTLTGLDVSERKDEVKYHREKYELQQHLYKIKDTQYCLTQQKKSGELPSIDGAAAADDQFLKTDTGNEIKYSDTAKRDGDARVFTKRLHMDTHDKNPTDNAIKCKACMMKNLLVLPNYIDHIHNRLKIATSQPILLPSSRNISRTRRRRQMEENMKLPPVKLERATASCPNSPVGSYRKVSSESTSSAMSRRTSSRRTRCDGDDTLEKIWENVRRGSVDNGINPRETITCQRLAEILNIPLESRGVRSTKKELKVKKYLDLLASSKKQGEDYLHMRSEEKALMLSLLKDHQQQLQRKVNVFNESCN